MLAPGVMSASSMLAVRGLLLPQKLSQSTTLPGRILLSMCYWFNFFFSRASEISFNHALLMCKLISLWGGIRIGGLLIYVSRVYPRYPRSHFLDKRSSSLCSNFCGVSHGGESDLLSVIKLPSAMKPIRMCKGRCLCLHTATNRDASLASVMTPVLSTNRECRGTP